MIRFKYLFHFILTTLLICIFGNLSALDRMGPLEAINNVENPQESSRKPKYVRGIHITPWLAGSRRGRERINSLLYETELNTVVIAIKEIKGEVYIPGVQLAEEYSTYVPAIPNIKEYLADLKKRNVYTIARIVVFKDDLLSRIKPELAVQDSFVGVWEDNSRMAWLDPFNRENWKYTIEIAKQAAKLGFDEIQYDYIRFPSDGNVQNCKYNVDVYTSTAAVKILVEFLKESKKALEPLGVLLSVDLFGLTTTNTHDMGIGQKLVEMAEAVDYVSPMVYPSHYRKGEYGIPDPEREPYATVFFSVSGAKIRLKKDFKKLRPYLQDFSLKVKYDAYMVRDQIQACYDNDVAEWILWDPSCKFTREALKKSGHENTYEKSGRIDPRDIYKSSATIKTSK